MSIFINTFNQVAPMWSDLLTIDHFYYHHETNYDGGLSFIDRINKKLGRFHPEWDITSMKNSIVSSKYPQNMYVNTILFMLSDPKDVLYYGI
jgi:hypothetical protein